MLPPELALPVTLPQLIDPPLDTDPATLLQVTEASEVTLARSPSHLILTSPVKSLTTT